MVPQPRVRGTREMLSPLLPSAPLCSPGPRPPLAAALLTAPSSQPGRRASFAHQPCENMVDGAAETVTRPRRWPAGLEEGRGRGQGGSCGQADVHRSVSAVGPVLSSPSQALC